MIYWLLRSNIVNVCYQFYHSASRGFQCIEAFTTVFSHYHVAGLHDLFYLFRINLGASAIWLLISCMNYVRLWGLNIQGEHACFLSFWYFNKIRFKGHFGILNTLFSVTLATCS